MQAADEADLGVALAMRQPEQHLALTFGETQRAQRSGGGFQRAVRQPEHAVLAVVEQACPQLPVVAPERRLGREPGGGDPPAALARTPSAPAGAAAGSLPRRRYLPGRRTPGKNGRAARGRADCNRRFRQRVPAGRPPRRPAHRSRNRSAASSSARVRVRSYASRQVRTQEGEQRAGFFRRNRGDARFRPKEILREDPVANATPC